MSNEAVCTQTSDKSRSTANKAIGCATCTDPGPKRGRVSWARAKITLSGVGMRGKGKEKRPERAARLLMRHVKRLGAQSRWGNSIAPDGDLG